jgi:phosphate-selective porin OprO/OprP
LQGAGDIKFLERSYVTNAILPNRDLGVAVYGSVLDKKLDYAFGIVNGVADGGNISTGAEYNGEREYTGRLFASPFKDDISPLNGLSFGIAATYTDFTGAKNLNFTDTSAADATRNGLPSYVTEGQNTFFRYNSGIIADGQRVRWTPQASYYLGPLGIIAEYAQVSQEVSKASGGSDSGGGGSTNTSILAGSNKKLEHNAWNLGVSYLITGEDASFKGVKPKTDFDIDKSGWGAWELVARYSGLNLDENTFKNKAGEYAADGSTEILAYADLTKSAKSAQTWTAGVNWYLNQNAKFAINYAHTSFEGGAIVGGGTGNPTTAADTRNVKDRPDEKAILARFQVTF